MKDGIHPEVRKLYPGADTPEFDFDASSPEVLVMNYRSKRKLCSLVEGFTEGAASHYNEAVAIKHPLCMHRGDEACRLCRQRHPSAGAMWVRIASITCAL